MAAMLSKFRIDYSDVIVITDITKKPQQSTREYFNDLTKNFVETDGTTGKSNFVIWSLIFAFLPLPRSNNHH